MTEQFKFLEPSPFKQYGDYFIVSSTIQNNNYLKVLKYDPTKDISSSESSFLQFEEVKSIQIYDEITSIGWTTFGSDSEKEYLGFLITGHASGALSLWSVFQILNSTNERESEGLIKQVSNIHSSKVNIVKFNSERNNIAATGSNEVVIVQIRQDVNGGFDFEVGFVCENHEERSEVTSIAWNDAVNFILAIGYYSSMVYIWDIKKKSIRFKIRDQLMTEDKKNIITKVNWSSDGMFIIISYDDPEFNFLTQYNISQLTAPFAEYHGGHKKAVTEIVKNPFDSNIILSLGKDNSIACWSIRSQKIYATYQKEETINQIVWSPKYPDCYITVSDTKIEINQVNFSSNPLLYTSEEEEELPKWMIRKSMSAFGWGGKFVTVNDKLGGVVNIHALNSGNSLTSTISDYLKSFNEDKRKYIEDKVNSLQSAEDTESLLFYITLKCIQNKNYSELFKIFGYDREKLVEDASKNVDKSRKTEKGVSSKPERRGLLKDQVKSKQIDAHKIFDSQNESEVTKQSQSVKSNSKAKEVEEEQPNIKKYEVQVNLNWNLNDEKYIKASLLAGELELAMENAFKAKRDAEALLIASNDPELFQKAKQEYFKRSSDIFIKNVFASIINKNFNHLLSGNLKDWKEYLLYGLTYLDNNQFTQFSKLLGEKLLQYDDTNSSLICLLLGNEPGLVIEKLYEVYQKQLLNSYTTEEKENLLHLLYEQISIINYIFGDSHLHSDIKSMVTVQYCELLVNHKLYVEACNLLIKVKNPELSTLLLFDRIYGNNEDKLSGIIKRPTLPFKEVHIKTYVPKKIVTSTKPIISNNHPQQTAQNIFGLNNNVSSSKPPVKNPIGIGIKQNQNISSNQIPTPIPQPIQSSSQSNETSGRPTNFVPNNEEKKVITSVKQPIVKPPIMTSVPKPILPTPVSQNISTDTQSTQPSTQSTGYDLNPQKSQFPVGGPIKSLPTKTAMQPIQNIRTDQNNIVNNQVNQVNNQTQQQQTQMDEEETRIYEAFEQFQESYISVTNDVNKVKDMQIKISCLHQKLKTHEIKINLKKLLLQYIEYVNSNAPLKDLQSLVRKIQAIQWDQNKTWMPCLERIIIGRK